MAGAFAIANPGDTIYVSDNHAETQASSMTLTSPGSATNPVKILCVDDTGDPASPTTLATTATVTVSNSGASITIRGYAYCYGITFHTSSTGGSGITISNASANVGWSMEQCTLKLSSTNASVITVGSGSGQITWLELINCTLFFSSTTSGLNPVESAVIWRGGSVAGSTLPSALIKGSAVGRGKVEVLGVDLSALGSGKALVDLAVSQGVDILFANCKLGASVSVTTGTHTGIGGREVKLINCDSGDTNYNFYTECFAGSVQDETTLVRSGGASDGTTPLSWKMVSNANARFDFPLASLPIVLWNDAVGSSKTLTVEILHDSATALTDEEVWLECEFLGTSGFPLSSFVSDRKSNILASAANQDSSSASWTTTGMSNPNAQKLSLTFTPQEKGPLRARVMLAKASKVIYVCPKAVLS